MAKMGGKPFEERESEGEEGKTLEKDETE